MMALPVRDPLVDLELRRLQLEEQVSKLQSALRHWQSWEAEYEGLKEELEILKDDSTQADLIATARDFGGTLVNEEEVFSLLGAAKLNRSKAQVIGLLGRRIDYVHQNVTSVQKQLTTAQERLKSVLIVLYPEAPTEEGLPLMEIIEELDEEGRVISSSTKAPAESAPELFEALRKAGVKDLTLVEKPEAPSRTSKAEPSASPISGLSTDENDNKPIFPPETTNAALQDNHLRPATESSLVENPPRATREIRDRNLKSSGDTVRSAFINMKTTQEVESQPTGTTHPSLESATVPTGFDDESDHGIEESSEDAELRREMREYGLNGLKEVGAVVAELEIDDEGVDDEAIDIPSDEEYDMDGVEDMFYSDDEDDDGEDEYGRSTGPLIDKTYRDQMLALQKKVKDVDIRNVGPERDTDIPPNKDMVEPVVSSELPAMIPKSSGPTKVSSESKKKKVAFAEELDIAPLPENSNKQTAKMDGKKENLPPTVKDTIVERRPQLLVSAGSSDPKPPKKTSRFKASRVTTSPTQPTQGSSATVVEEPVPTHSSTIIERDSMRSAPKLPDLDDFDETLHKQEIATEYNSTRNKMIRRQGGFSRDEDEDDQQFVPLREEEGGPKKMSRFKAARQK